MLLYGIIIIICMAIIATLNAFFNTMNEPWYYYVIATVIFTVAVIVLDGIVAGIARAMPKKWFDPNKKFFTANKKILNFYQKIGVKKWKDHIPELGQFTGFHKNHVAEPGSPEYVSRFMLEAAYGIGGHFWSMPLSYLIIFIDFRMWNGSSNLWLTVAIPVAFVSMVLNYLPYAVLRFNLPKLKALYKISLRSSKPKDVQQ